ncbi:hypothetical protein CRG98_007692 [Punica granatum]|uniref:Uncharacterized protein n=1 Tax=Punica granatum TaxID=22663 RepID=A0A2I0KTX7_PUNGR|nr:hypothetical protein CRG98_007692 [Punica granatum]
MFAAVSCVLSRRRHDTQKREPPSAAAGILLSAHLHLLRSSPLSRARPIFLRFAQVRPVRPSSSPSETTRPSLSPDPFGLTQKSARNSGSRRTAQFGPPVLFHGPTLPFAAQSPRIRPSSPAPGPACRPNALPAGLNCAERLLPICPEFLKLFSIKSRSF